MLKKSSKLSSYFEQMNCQCTSRENGGEKQVILRNWDQAKMLAGNYPDDVKQKLRLTKKFDCTKSKISLKDKCKIKQNTQFTNTSTITASKTITCKYAAFTQKQPQIIPINLVSFAKARPRSSASEYYPVPAQRKIQYFHDLTKDVTVRQANQTILQNNFKNINNRPNPQNLIKLKEEDIKIQNRPFYGRTQTHQNRSINQCLNRSINQCFNQVQIPVTNNKKRVQPSINLGQAAVEPQSSNLNPSINLQYPQSSSSILDHNSIFYTQPVIDRFSKKDKTCKNKTSFFMKDLTGSISSFIRGSSHQKLTELKIKDTQSIVSQEQSSVQYSEIDPAFQHQSGIQSMAGFPNNIEDDKDSDHNATVSCREMKRTIETERQRFK